MALNPLGTLNSGCHPSTLNPRLTGYGGKREPKLITGVREQQALLIARLPTQQANSRSVFPFTILCPPSPFIPKKGMGAVQARLFVLVITGITHQIRRSGRGIPPSYGIGYISLGQRRNVCTGTISHSALACAL